MEPKVNLFAGLARALPWQMDNTSIGVGNNSEGRAATSLILKALVDRDRVSSLMISSQVQVDAFPPAVIYEPKNGVRTTIANPLTTL